MAAGLSPDPLTDLTALPQTSWGAYCAPHMPGWIYREGILTAWEGKGGRQTGKGREEASERMGKGRRKGEREGKGDNLSQHLLT